MLSGQCVVQLAQPPLAHWDLIQTHRDGLHCAVSLLDWNTAALLQEGSFLRLSTVTQFQGIQTMLVRPFLLQKRQACVMCWQQRLPVLSEHVSMPLNSFNQVNVATYNVMQPLVLVILGKCFIFLLLAGIQDFFKIQPGHYSWKVIIKVLLHWHAGIQKIWFYLAFDSILVFVLIVLRRTCSVYTKLYVWSMDML